jgi:uncharacterized protein
VILYLDSSSLAKLYVDEPGSLDVVTLVGQADVVATSALAYAEVRSALTRRRRERTMTAGQLRAAREMLDSDWATFLVLPCDKALARDAGDLAEKHSLRGADAVHLAAFERLLSSADDEDVEFSCSDDRLNRAARRLG